MLDIPIERSVSIGKARESLENTLQHYSISWKIEVTGTFIYTAKCSLYSNQGEFLDYGYGKGDIASSELGALFEAVEHWFGQFQNSGKKNIDYSTALEFLEKTEFSNNLPISIINDSPDGIIALRKYNRIGRSESLYYPVALSSPKYIDDISLSKSKYPPDNFNYSKIDRYSSNSGMAIGSNETEAVIHGLLEAVERDSFSIFLIDFFLNKNKESLRIVNPNTLPDDLLSLFNSVECEVNHNILLIELVNDFGIPVFCATLRKSSFPIEVTGYGCSLSRNHAICRSLHELTQCFHATDRFHPQEFEIKANAILSKFHLHKFHLRCAQLKIAEWSDQIGFVEVDFSDTAKLNAPADLHDYLHGLVSQIEKSGRRTFSSIVNQLTGGQIVAHSFIEAYDHFFCVTEGCFVFPNRKNMV